MNIRFAHQSGDDSFSVRAIVTHERGEYPGDRGGWTADIISATLVSNEPISVSFAGHLLNYEFLSEVTAAACQYAEEATR